MSQMRRNTCTMLTYFVAPWHSVIDLRVIDRGSLVNLHRLCNDMESRREPRNVFPLIPLSHYPLVSGRFSVSPS